MRPLYLFLRITLPYALSVFFKRTKTLNAQKKLDAQTIFVCNHPSAFMDPLVAANFQSPVIYFATRGDIFNKWLHPITWASHMVPIFRRDEDGTDAMKKNKDSFRYLGNVLLKKKSLILFGEGYTDNVFIRSLKPIKKGPARIGFETMERCNWEEDIKVQAIGLNYSHPKSFRSDVLICMGDCIHLKEYKALHDENPTKAVTELTRRIQDSMRSQLTYVDDKSLAPFVEQLLILSRKGMNHIHHDAEHSLESRFNFSRQLSQTVNETYETEKEKWSALKNDVEEYFEGLEKKGLNDNWIVRYMRKGSQKRPTDLLMFILGFPLALLGAIHNFVAYILIKRFVEKTFKREVFWSGVKMILGTTASALWNIPIFFLFTSYVYDSYLLACIYYLTVPAICGIFAHHYVSVLGDYLKSKKISEQDIQSSLEQRKNVIQKINALNLFEDNYSL